MTVVRTSDSHPLRVDFLPAEIVPTPGRIGLTFAPGKCQLGGSGYWQRDLDKDLARLREYYRTDILVSLIEEHEFEELKIQTLRARAKDYGIEILWFPIRDMAVPAEVKPYATLIEMILSALRAGKTIVAHCMGGLGRTGLVAASTLVALGLTADEAINAVKAARAGSLGMSEQEKFVALFSAFLKEHPRSQPT
ncbi:MAG TPA: cyclin-dependent kinase inhibitor 3 family protein [Pyrinomonadaceae bacterium]|jgi:protein-tyrosine phosphatase